MAKFQLAAGLGLNDLVGSLVGNPKSQQEAVENFLWNSYVFNHEADALGINPNNDELAAELAKVPAFQTSGKFDQAKLAMVIHDRLPSLGFSEAVIDELVRDQVRVQKVKDLVGSTVELSKAELDNRYKEENQKMEISVARLNTSDIENAIAVSDADAQKEYDAHKDAFRSDEQRKVDVASFELTDAQKELKGKDRTDVLQKLGNDAWTFAQAVVDKSSDFAGKAREAGAQVTTSGTFSANQPDPALDKVPALAENAFKLTADYPTSDVVEGQNGYYVLRLDSTVPSRQLSFDDAKPKVIAEIRQNQAAQLMQTKAVEARTKLVAALKAGKPFADAAKAAGVQAEVVPPFSLMDASKVDMPDSKEIIQNAVALADGQLSEFVSTATGGLIVFMKDRLEPDPAIVAMGEEMVKEQFKRQKESAAFEEWLRLRKDKAKLQIVAQR